MLAAYHGHAPLVSLLLRHGADPNRLNDRGQSPLAGVVFKNEADVIKILLDGGADPEIGTPSALDSTKVSQRSFLSFTPTLGLEDLAKHARWRDKWDPMVPVWSRGTCQIRWSAMITRLVDLGARQRRPYVNHTEGPSTSRRVSLVFKHR